MRRTIITAIMFLWVGSLLALFLSDPAGVQPTPPPSLDSSPTEAEEWWGVYMQGHKIGFVRHSLTEAGAGLAFQDETVLRLTTLGEKQTVRTTASGTMTRSFELEKFKMTLSAGPSRLAVEAAVHGTELWVSVAPEADAKVDTRISLDGPLSIPMGIRKAALSPPLEAGRVTRGAVFDPLTRTSSPLTLTIGERQPLPGDPGTTAWRVDERWRDVSSVLWVDEDGRLLREEGPMGLVAIREDKRQAQAPAEDSDWDAVDAVSIPVNPPIEDARTRETLRVRLAGIDAERIPTGGGQSVKGSEVLIRRLPLDELESYPLPYTAAAHARELEATEGLQADHPRIKTLAETILGGERDALAATQLLREWVYRYLKKIPTASFPNALEVLDAGQGDCNEHAVLFTALARAAGIPARVVSGTVYAERAFLYHAWTEVWLGRWVGVDPALNQMPADATHIRLTAGDRDAHMLMMGILGNLRIEVLADDDKAT